MGAMELTWDATRQHLTERLCQEVARGDDARGTRRLYRQQVIDGMYRLDEGTWLDDLFHVLQAVA